MLGVNYYQPRRIKAKETPVDPAAEPMPENYFDVYDMPGKKMNPYRGWEIYEKKGIYDILINLRDNYGMPCFISEMAWGLKMNVVS